MSQFEEEASRVLSDLQHMLRDIIACFGDPAVIRPVDLCELTGADMNLAWKVSRLVNAGDVFSLGKYLPGKKALLSFASMAGRAGVPGELVKGLKGSAQEMESLIRTSAGSRKEFQVMLAGLSTEERRMNDSIHRRKAFEGNSYTFGVQSDIQLATNIVMPSTVKPGTVDICRIKGQVGLYRTRPDVPWRVASTYIIDSRGSLKTTPSREFLFPAKEGMPPVIEEFSSPDLPEFGRVTDNSGKTSYYLKGREIGLKSSINIFTGEVLRATGKLYRENPEEGLALNNSSRTPTRKFVIEAYFAREFTVCPYEVEMWSMLFPAMEYSGMTPGDRLPLSEQPQLFRAGRAPVPLSGVPGYADLMQACFTRLKQDAGSYSLLRLTMDYPPIPASIDFLLGLPEP